MAFYGKPVLLLVDLIFSYDRKTEQRYGFIERKGDTLYALKYFYGKFLMEREPIYGLRLHTSPSSFTKIAISYDNLTATDNSPLGKMSKPSKYKNLFYAVYRGPRPKYEHWAKELFKSFDPSTLKEQVYFYIAPWQTDNRGPSGLIS